jgi:hypothetical protein
VPVSQQNIVSASSPDSFSFPSEKVLRSPSNAVVLINEVMFNPSAGSFEWVELKNVGPGPIDISGYSLTDEDDNWFVFPDAFPPVPEGAFVVVVFDGAGSTGNDYDFGDNSAILHSQTGMIDIFEDDFDQVSIYDKPTQVFLPLLMNGSGSTKSQFIEPRSTLTAPVTGNIMGFVAWGVPPLEDAIAAEQSGLWNQSWFVSLSTGLGFDIPIETEDYSIGLLHNSLQGFLNDWGLYQSVETTLGGENNTPVISWFHYLECN